jgi:hypothetical protein
MNLLPYDDDAVPDPAWLRALVVNFGSPNVMCVTGLTMPVELETEAQEAFERYSPFCKGFTRKIYTGEKGNPIATGKIGAGVNMALRKSVTDKVGFFDEPWMREHPHILAVTMSCLPGFCLLVTTLCMTLQQ